MATQDPNTWERFYLHLVTDSKKDADIFQALTRFHDIASNGTQSQLTQEVRKLAQTYGEQYLFSSADITNMVDEVGPWRDVNFPLTQPQAQQQEPTQQQPFQLFSKKEKKPTGGGLPPKQKTEATEQILSIQETQLLQRFEEIDNMEPGEARDAAIEEFLNSLDAPGLLRGQHSILLSHIQQLGIGEDDERHKTVREFLGQREDQVDKDWEERINEEERAKRRQAVHALFRNPHDANQLSAAQRRSQLQDIIQDRQNEIHETYGDLFEEEEISVIFGQEELYDKLLFGLNQSIEAYQRQQEEQQAIHAAQAPQQTPPQQPTAPTPAPRVRRGASNFFKNAGLRVLERLGPEGATAAFLIKHKKLVMFLLIGLVFLVVFFVVAIVTVIIDLVGGGGSSPQPVLSGPQCTNTLQCKADLSQLGITLTGDLSLNGDPNGKIAQIFNTIQLVSQPPSQFLQLLKLPTTRVTINVGATGCGGHSNYNGVDYFGWCNNASVNRFILLHELGHVIAFRNPALFGKFYIEGLLNSFFSSIFNPSTLPTFNCRYDYGIGPYPGECWADSVGEYVTYPYYRNTVSGNPQGPYNFANFPSFAGGFYYNFMSTDVYKGADYSKITAP